MGLDAPGNSDAAAGPGGSAVRLQETGRGRWRTHVDALEYNRQAKRYFGIGRPGLKTRAAFASVNAFRKTS